MVCYFKDSRYKISQSFRKQYNCDFISAMPTNPMEWEDNYHLENAHAI